VASLLLDFAFIEQDSLFSLVFVSVSSETSFSRLVSSSGSPLQSILQTQMVVKKRIRKSVASIDSCLIYIYIYIYTHIICIFFQACLYWQFIAQ
jgi:hypothetical protein